MTVCRDDQLYVIGVHENHVSETATRLTFHTTRGDFNANIQIKHGVKRGIVMLGDASPGFNGPVSMYPSLADDLLECGIASIRLDYRVPGDCCQCAIDALLAVQYLDDEGVSDVILLGWSFGAAVAMAVGSLAKTVNGIVALAPVEDLECRIRRLKCKPTLLVHGEADEVSPVEVSYRACEKSCNSHKLVIYPGVGHDFEGVRDDLHDELISWISNTFKITDGCDTNISVKSALNSVK